MSNIHNIALHHALDDIVRIARERGISQEEATGVWVGWLLTAQARLSNPFREGPPPLPALAEQYHTDTTMS